MDPAAFSAVRFIVSAIPFLPFVFEARKDVQTRKAGMELGLWISLGHLIEALGLLTAEAGRASFISLFTVSSYWYNYMINLGGKKNFQDHEDDDDDDVQVIVVPLLESVFGTIVPARTWFGVFMSVLGLGMLECSGTPPNVSMNE